MGSWSKVRKQIHAICDKNPGEKINIEIHGVSLIHVEYPTDFHVNFIKLTPEFHVKFHPYPQVEFPHPRGIPRCSFNSRGIPLRFPREYFQFSTQISRRIPRIS